MSCLPGFVLVVEGHAVGRLLIPIVVIIIVRTQPLLESKCKKSTVVKLKVTVWHSGHRLRFISVTVTMHILVEANQLSLHHFCRICRSVLNGNWVFWRFVVYAAQKQKPYNRADLLQSEPNSLKIYKNVTGIATKQPKMLPSVRTKYSQMSQFISYHRKMTQRDSLIIVWIGEAYKCSLYIQYNKTCKNIERLIKWFSFQEDS